MLCVPDAIVRLVGQRSGLNDMEDSAEDEPERAEREEEEVAPLPLDEPLLAETARSSVRESLTALAMLAEPGARPQIVRSGETSLEGLVRDMLRPMLAQWLETHLPAIVDRMVQAEIARIAGKKG